MVVNPPFKKSKVTHNQQKQMSHTYKLVEATISMDTKQWNKVKYESSDC